MHAPHHHHPVADSHAAAPAAPLPAGTVYTCPMHPEIRQPNPGNCPKCGMTLEPVMPEAEEQGVEQAVVSPAAISITAGRDGCSCQGRSAHTG